MKPREVAAAAKNYVSEVLSDEKPINIGLEEIAFDSDQDLWEVTVGFSRPWSVIESSIAVNAFEPALRRAYRVLQVSDKTGEVVSMKRRDFAIGHAVDTD